MKSKKTKICKYCGVYLSEHDRNHLATECFPMQIKKLNIIVAKYNELLMAVESKFPGESRHETALRYIKRAEKHDATENNTGYSSFGEF